MKWLNWRTALDEQAIPELKSEATDNRPFLRCMHGFGLCLWRLRRFEEAERIFDRMLWLNPSDNQGVRFMVGQVRAKTAWEECRQ